MSNETNKEFGETRRSFPKPASVNKTNMTTYELDASISNNPEKTKNEYELLIFFFGFFWKEIPWLQKFWHPQVDLV